MIHWIQLVLGQTLSEETRERGGRRGEERFERVVLVVTRLFRDPTVVPILVDLLEAAEFFDSSLVGGLRFPVRVDGWIDRID